MGLQINIRNIAFSMNDRQTNMKSISFTGYYGMKNFGDDLFGMVCGWGAAEYWTRVNSSILSPPILGVNNIFSVPAWFSQDLYASPRYYGKASRLFFALRETKRCNEIILGGGSVLGSTQSGVRDFINKIAVNSGLEFSGIGISIGPFPSTEVETKVREFLKRFQYLSVRDISSYQMAIDFELSCPVVMAGDLAGLMPLILPSYKKVIENKTNIGIALCNYESIIGGNLDDEKIRNKAILDGLVKVAKQNETRVEVFILNNHPQFGDDKLAREIMTRLQDENIECGVSRNIDLGVEEIWKQISQCDAFVSVRLHGAIAAYLNDVPFALIEYHKKCTDFLDDIGQEKDNRLGRRINSSDRVAVVIQRLLASPMLPRFSTKEYGLRAIKHFTEAPWAS